MTKNTLLLTFLIFVFLLTACGNNNEPLEQIDENNSNDVQTIDQQDEKEDYMNRVINVGTIHAPPYEMVENTEYSGPGIEIVIAVLESLEYEYTIQDYPWIRNLEMMEAGDLDMLVDAYITPERQAFAYYSQIPYGIFPQALFTCSDSTITFNGDLSSLKDYTIGIIRGYSYGAQFDTALKDYTINFSESNNARNMFIKLENNRIDLAADNLHEGREIIAELGKEDKFVILKPYFDTLFSYVIFSKKKII